MADLVGKKLAHFNEIDHVHGIFALGEAREHAGDVAGARAAYEEVLRRWGKAKPRSVTADKARARLARLAK
jgi:eukaryotic-like serine/threonine-protein kinase